MRFEWADIRPEGVDLKHWRDEFTPQRGCFRPQIHPVADFRAQRADDRPQKSGLRL